MVNLGPQTGPQPPPVQPQNGWIGLTRIPGGAGSLIRALQFLNGDGFSEYEHAFMVSSVGDLFPTGVPGGAGRGTVWVVEAEPGGAVQRPLHYDPASIAWIRPPDEQTGLLAAREAVKLADRHIGYSFLDYEALALHKFHIPAPGLRSFIEDSGHMICSQLVDHAAMMAGWNLFSDGRWEGYVTPGALWKIAEEQFEERMK